MTTVVIQLIVVYTGDNAPEDVIEQQVLQSYVLADCMEVADWANQEITDGGLGDEAFVKLADDKYPPGVYSLIGMFSLRDGKDQDTPNGPGEYWSTCEPEYVALPAKLSIDEAKHYLDEDVSFIQEDIDFLFDGKKPKPETFLFDTGKDNDEDAPHSQG